MSVWITPASNKDSKIHIDLTVDNFILNETLDGIVETNNKASKYWGFAKNHEKKFNDFKVGDTLVFYQNKALTRKCKIKSKLNSVKASYALWPASSEDLNWPFIVELDNVEEINVPIKKYNSALGYSERNVVQGNQLFKNNDPKCSIIMEMIDDIFVSSIVEQELESSYVVSEATLNDNHVSEYKAKPFDMEGIMNSKRKTDEEKLFKSQQKVGKHSEEVVVEYLKGLDLYDKVLLMRDVNDRSPFDIFCSKNDQKFYVEVKGTSMATINTSFFMSIREVEFAKYCYENEVEYKLIRVVNAAIQPKVIELDYERLIISGEYLNPTTFKVNMANYSIA